MVGQAGSETGGVRARQGKWGKWLASCEAEVENLLAEVADTGTRLSVEAKRALRGKCEWPWLALYGRFAQTSTESAALEVATFHIRTDIDSHVSALEYKKMRVEMSRALRRYKAEDEAHAKMLLVYKDEAHA